MLQNLKSESGDDDVISENNKDIANFFEDFLWNRHCAKIGSIFFNPSCHKGGRSCYQGNFIDEDPSLVQEDCSQSAFQNVL